MSVGESSLPESINPINFPAKLWRLVNNPAYEAICWDSLGEVLIINQRLFEKQVLSPPSSSTSDNRDAFKTSNFTSFVRQLNLYGFRKGDPPVKNCPYPTRVTGTCHYFYNPNFKRNHPELVATLRRLTADNKAKLKAGLDVACRPPGQYQKHVKKVTSPLGPTQQESALLYPDKARTRTALNGTPAPPRCRRRARVHGAPLSDVPVSLSPYYTAVAPRPAAMHVLQDQMAYAHHASFHACTAQYPPGFYSQYVPCYYPNFVASHMTEIGLQTGPFSPHGYYLIPDEVMPAQTGNGFVVSPEKTVPVSDQSSCNQLLLL
ncbi:heat shock factor protein 5 [Scophthalmus maximus]|uniref:heat shock factor protein 5 n=1 Tax=Scophthalmus maximus TaxID=52904 RepID=UPI0015E06CFA|nr:heat shock factor protein 5 [Scophthalmus maximus]